MDQELAAEELVDEIDEAEAEAEEIVEELVEAAVEGEVAAEALEALIESGAKGTRSKPSRRLCSRWPSRAWSPRRSSRSWPRPPSKPRSPTRSSRCSTRRLCSTRPRRSRSRAPTTRPGQWFVAHTQSGYEKKVKQNLEAASSMNMEDRIHEVVIPMEDVVEFKNGKKVVVQKKVFPGYLLVRCHLDDDSWYVVRNTPGVTGFVGQGAKPSPMRRKDVENFLQVKPEGDEAPKRGKPRLEYEQGETVRVKEGPFADFSGEIVEINEDQLKVKVLVNIFGRETPVESKFSEVAKL